MERRNQGAIVAEKQARSCAFSVLAPRFDVALALCTAVPYRCVIFIRPLGSLSSGSTS